MLIAILGGIAVGLLMGALGGGGAILSIPLLVFGLGIPPQQAAVASLLIVGIGALTGVLAHDGQGNVRLREGLLFGALGLAGSALGTGLARGISGELLLVLFSALLMVVAALMFRRALTAPGAFSGHPGRASGEVPGSAGATTSSHALGGQGSRGRWGPLIATASGVGFLTGFFGVGGGFVIVPALALVLGFEMAAAVGTSLVVIAVNSAAALAFHAGTVPHLPWGVVVPFALAAVVGTLLGGRLTRVLPRHILQIGFAVFLLCVAVYTAWQSVPALL